MTQTYFRADGSTLGPAVDAREAERSTGMKGGIDHGTRAGTPTGRVYGVGVVAGTGALTGRVALTGGWGLLAAVSLAAVSW